MPRESRNFRVEADLWAAAKAKAAEQGTDVSAVLRALLREWVGK